MNLTHSHVILDTCCLINFSASGNLLAILKAIPATVAVAQVVKDEELKTIQTIKNQEENQLDTAISQGILKVVDFESEEEAELFVNYAAVIGDGESATGAIAINRGWAMATDDKKAISFFRPKAPQLKIISTLEIVKYWSEQASVDDLELKQVLNAIRTKGRYIPQKNHPLLSWWTELVD